MEEHHVRMCPKCGSTKLKNFYLMSPMEMAVPGAKKLKERMNVNPVGSLVIGWQPQNPEVYVCLECDYSGICPEVAVSGVEHFKKSLRKN